jgi:hypothetical protein
VQFKNRELHRNQENAAVEIVSNNILNSEFIDELCTKDQLLLSASITGMEVNRKLTLKPFKGL